VSTAVGLVASGLGVALLPANTPRLPGIVVLPLRQARAADRDGRAVAPRRGIDAGC